MIELSLSADFSRMERALQAAVGQKAIRSAAARALSRVATYARADVQKRLPSIFDRPVSWTINSVRYQKATEENLTAGVFISDDPNKGGLSARKFLGAQMRGGLRGNKRSENLLRNSGLARADQQWVPGSAMQLDAHGNVPGSRMAQILSRLSAFHEMGFSANVSERTKNRLMRKNMGVQKTRTEFFIAHDRGGDPLGVWQLMGPGQVRPVLIFTNRRPSYRVRFPLRDMVKEFCSRRFPALLREEISNGIR